MNLGDLNLGNLSLENLIGLILACLLAGYLIVALIRPEKF